MTNQVQIIPYNAEAERGVIGGLMLNTSSDRAAKAMNLLKPESFYIAAHRIIFGEMQNLIRKNQPVDLLTMDSRLKSAGVLDDVGGFAYLAELSKTPSAANIVAYAEIVRDEAMRRFALTKLQECQGLLLEKSTLTAQERIEFVGKFMSEIADYGRTGKTSGLRSANDVAADWVNEYETRQKNPSAVAGLSTGIEELDRLLGGKKLVKQSLVVVGARPKVGKAQPLNSKILLGNGSWKTFANIQIGDKLASIDGGESTVTGVFPQGERDIYTVTFSDGRQVDCADEHLWEIHSSKFSEGSRVVDTMELKRLLSCVRYQNRIHVSGISGDFGEKIDLGLSPWLIGALLGDGYLNGTPKISMSEPYMIERVRKELGDDFSVTLEGGIDYRLTHKFNSNLSPVHVLRKLGINGKKAEDKFIPEIVFSADKRTRIDLLCGLLETDGWVQGRNNLSFSTASKALSDGVQTLVFSLGGVCRCTIKKSPKYSYKGEIRTGRDAYICLIRLPDDVIACIQSPRIKNGFKHKRVKTSEPVITSVEFKKRDECVCIMVSHPRHLYATDNYIMTHNTSLYATLAVNCVMREKRTALLFSLEMSDKAIFERMFTQLGNVKSAVFYEDPNMLANMGIYVDGEISKGMDAIGGLINSDLLFIDDTPAASMSHIRNECRRMKRERGEIGLIAVDYLTLMKAEAAERNDLAYGQITKELKNLAREMDCVVLLLTQLNRKLEDRGDKRPLPSDSRDTGQIEQECDYWFGLYKDSVYNKNADPTLTEIIVRLNRHGATGTVFVDQRDGAFFNCDQADAMRRAELGKPEAKQKRKPYAAKEDF